MSNIIVTSPKHDMAKAAAEAAEVIANGGGYYFRVLYSKPNIKPGESVFYVEDGHIRGFAKVVEVYRDMNGGIKEWICDTTGQGWTMPASGCVIRMDATSWKWIKPIPMKGFQGWRYFNQEVEVIGDWLDPKPSTNAQIEARILEAAKIEPAFTESYRRIRNECERTHKFSRKMVILLAHEHGLTLEACVRKCERLGLTQPNSWEWFEDNGGFPEDMAARVLAGAVA